MAEREISVDHSTILRLGFAGTRRNLREMAPLSHLIGPSWRVDETYVKVGGTWTYLYRGVDKSGKSTVSLLSRKRARSARRRHICVKRRERIREGRIPSRCSPPEAKSLQDRSSLTNLNFAPEPCCSRFGKGRRFEVWAAQEGTAHTAVLAVCRGDTLARKTGNDHGSQAHPC